MNTLKEGKRRWTPEEKLAIVNESYASGMSVTSVARIYGVHPNQLSGWRRDARLGKLEVSANPSSIELSNAQRRIRELERLLGAKTLEVAMLRSALGSGDPASRRWNGSLETGLLPEIPGPTGASADVR